VFVCKVSLVKHHVLPNNLCCINYAFWRNLWMDNFVELKISLEYFRITEIISMLKSVWKLVFFMVTLVNPTAQSSQSATSLAEYRLRRRVYKRQCRTGIFSVGIIALCLVAASNVSNNNSRITKAKRSRRSTGMTNLYES